MPIELRLYFLTGLVFVLLVLLVARKNELNYLFEKGANRCPIPITLELFAFLTVVFAMIAWPYIVLAAFLRKE